jgi:phenylalanyl-tRNA synthetase beta chain
MRVPLSWLLEYAPVGPLAGIDAEEVGRRLTACGLEVESLERVGQDISGVVVGQVLDVEELTGFKKPVRYCQVDAGDGQERHVICGASNFAAGDRIVLALPGAVLPGGFEIGARKTYGKISEGMICSARELGIGDEHSGILVLPPGTPLGADFAALAGLADVVYDVNVTPDKGFALSIRGMARELAISYGVSYTDPAGTGLPADVAEVSGQVWPASIGDPTACDRFVLREVRGIDPARPTPLRMLVRLARAGQRSVSLAVDITNYVMLETGQPLHAFDAGRLSGPIVVRRAAPGERLETLDHVVRDLDPEDILITDSSGPISLAGTMGGLSTEITPDSRDLVIEAAHFSARGTARMSRRHRLFSEASARFERGVDYELQQRAAAKAAVLLAELAGGTLVPGSTYAREPVPEVSISLAADYPDRVAGVAYGVDTVVTRLRQVGCTVTVTTVADGPAGLTVEPPSWRPDLTDPADLAEEVIRLEGYEHIPVSDPRATAGRGLTGTQRLRRTIGRALAARGLTEVLSSTFISAADFDRLLLPAGDGRRQALAVANPLSEDEPLLRTTLLPGLLRVLARNIGRGFGDVALFESGLVFAPGPDGPRVAPIPGVAHAPSAQELARLNAALPGQPLRLGVVLAGDRDLPGWWGPGRPAGWQDAIEAARQVLEVSRVPFEVQAAQHEPWHPGRCAALLISAGGGASADGAGVDGAGGDGAGADGAGVDGAGADGAGTGRMLVVGHAGELHPRVTAAFGLPPRTAAVELDMTAIEAAAARLAPAPAPVISSYPLATQDVALIVADTVPAADVERALVTGAARAGDVRLEDLRLFDVYTGDQAGQGRKSLAYTLRFRAPDRTLTAEEASAARDAAVAEARDRTGAVLRGA